WAMLLERCEPGTYLSELGQDAALGVMVELLPRLWKPTGAPFRPLAEEAAWWIEIMPGDPGLRDTAISVLRELSDSQGEQVLLHRPARGARAVAGHRPEAAGRGARVRDRCSRSWVRARRGRAQRPPSARPADRGAGARSRARLGLGLRPDARVGERRRGALVA